MKRFECTLFATDSVAACARQSKLKSLFCLISTAFLLSACALPDKPTRSLMYDFGPGPLSSAPATRQALLPALAVDDITTAGGALDNMAVLYRLGYADGQQLRPYSQARWSMPPAQLVRQRLSEQLGQQRTVLNPRESVALNRGQNAALPLRLRIELEEFSQLFTAADASVGLVRLRATLLERTPGGEKLLGQRRIVVQRPAPSADAAGGVRALTAATDAAIAELDQWLQQQP